jgi:hypothetical protein
MPPKSATTTPAPTLSVLVITPDSPAARQFKASLTDALAKLENVRSEAMSFDEVW